MAEFRILHLSDLHIAKRGKIELLSGQRRAGLLANSSNRLHPRSHDPDIAERAAQIAFEEGNNVDLILVTGDLATTGKTEDLRLALSYVGADAHFKWLDREGRATLTGADVPVVLLPGNHDRYTRWLAAGGTEFDAVFREHWRVGQGVQTDVVLESFDGQDRLAIISADLTLASNADADSLPPWCYVGQGKAYEHLVERLLAESQTVRAEYAPVAVTWALHFAPDYPGIRRDLRLVDEEHLLLAATNAGVAHLFCGHTHSALDYASKKVQGVTVFCAGTTCESNSDEGNKFHLRTLITNGGRVVDHRTSDFVWQRDTAAFVRFN